jgi:tetratricopeptide (TPR) repeat protein
VAFSICKLLLKSFLFNFSIVKLLINSENYTKITVNNFRGYLGYMKKALLIASVLFIAVITTACINNIAVQELNNKAAEYMQKGDYEAAVNRLQASIDLDSSMYETYYNLGIAATNAKKYDVAIEAFENGIKIKPDYSNFYYSLGLAQSSYADELLDETADDNDNTKKISEEDKLKAEGLKKNASANLAKYLDLNPQAEDKQTVKALINDLNGVTDKAQRETVEE